MIVQCDSGHLHGDLIACARHRIYDLRAKADKMLATHVLFIVHLPQQVSSSSFVSFQGDPWISSHIDDLRQPSDTVVSTKEAITMTISEVFLGQKLFELSINKQPHEKLHPLRSPLFNRLHTCIQAAASRLKDSSIKRSTKRVEILVHLIPNDYPIVLGLSLIILSKCFNFLFYSRYYSISWFANHPHFQSTSGTKGRREGMGHQRSYESQEPPTWRNIPKCPFKESR